MPNTGYASKVRIGVTIDKELKEKLDNICSEDRRTFSSLVNHVLWEYANQREKDSESQGGK